jgi:cell division transport system permease protein
MFGRSDLPVDKDAASRFVQWLVMVLVFMAAIAATIGAYTGALLDHWDRSITGTLTVQLPSRTAGEPNEPIAAILTALQAHPDVANAAAVPREKVVTLLEPWLGERGTISDLPLPALIDVDLRTPDAGAAARVAEAVAKAAPDAVVDDHRVWLSRVTNLAEGVGIVAFSLLAVLAAALGLTVIFATRASLTEFHDVIEVLHLVGARDDHIAGQFARRALFQALLGGVLGLALFAPTLAAIAWLASRVQAGIFPDVSLPVSHWIVLAALPIAAGLLAMATAHVTVRRALHTLM